MTTTAPAKRKSRYTEDTIDRCLTEMVFCGGNYRHAHERLARDGINVPAETIRSWARRDHPERYETIREQTAEILAQQNERLAHSYASVELKALERMEDELHTIPTKDLAALAKNNAIGRGISISRAVELRGGNPIRVDVQLTADEALKQLASLAPGVVKYQDAIDSTATEDTNPPPLAAPAVARDVNARALPPAGS